MFFKTNDEKIEIPKFEKLKKFKNLWSESNYFPENNGLRNIFKNLKIENFLEKFENEEINEETLFLLSDQQIDSLIEKIGPNAVLKDFIKNNKK